MARRKRTRTVWFWTATYLRGDEKVQTRSANYYSEDEARGKLNACSGSLYAYDDEHGTMPYQEIRLQSEDIPA